MVKDIFKITPTGKVKENKRVTVSPYNSVKHLKYAKDMPVMCKDCVYRAVDVGGNGKCPKYDPDPEALCVIRKDLQEFLDDIDTRNSEDLRALLDFLAKGTFKNVMMSMFQAGWDGNIPDRNTVATVNLFLKVISTANELNDKISVTEKKTYSKEGDLAETFRMLTAKKESFKMEEDYGET